MARKPGRRESPAFFLFPALVSAAAERYTSGRSLQRTAMNQIQPYPLWLGHAGAGSDAKTLFDREIRALVHLAAEDLPAHPPRELMYCRFPLLDGAGNRPEILYLAIKMVADLLTLRISTLVFCGGGRSRSPAIAAGRLARMKHEPPGEWLKRPVSATPSDGAPCRRRGVAS